MRTGIGRAWIGALALAQFACVTPLQRGEKLYREGDPLGALETWRAIPEDEGDHAWAQERIAVVEAEFRQLVTRYKQRARYFEDRDRLAESILNDRLALKLQPDDAATLARVQQMARTLASTKAMRMAAYRKAFDAGDLGTARVALGELRALDSFDPQLETEERQLTAALAREISHRMAAGRRGFTAGNHTAAERAFRAVLELDPDNESAVGYLSFIATMRRESAGSGDEPAAFDPPPESFASDAQIRAEGFYQNATAADRAGDVYTAIRHDLRALRADPEHLGARRHLARLRARLVDEVDPLIEAGREAFRNEDLQSAIDLWRRALLIDPDNERAQAYIGRAERQLSNLERLRSEPDVSTEGE